MWIFFQREHGLHSLLHNLNLTEKVSRDWFILLIAKTGMRFSEALAITPADFDFSHQILSVSQTWNYKAGGGFSPGTDFPCHLGFRENDWAYQYVDYRYRFGQYVFQKDFILSKNLYGYGFPSAFLPFYLPFADFCAQQDKRFSGQSRPFPRELFKCHGSSGRERFPVCHPLWKRRGVCELYQHFHDPLYYHFHADSGVS